MNDGVGRNHLGELTINNIVLKSFDIVPNSFTDMQQMNESNKVKVRLFNIQSNIIRNDERIELEMINSVKNETFLVVFGGWIPCAFIKSNTILYADRNVITEITTRYKGGIKKSDKALDYFDSIFLHNKSVSIDISAFVIEANERKIPTNELINQQVASVKESLKRALPNLKIANYPGGNSYYHDLKDLLEPIMKKRMAFLQEVTPKLNRQFTAKSRKEAVNVVFKAAKKAQLSKNDLVIVLALLRVTMIGKKTAAQLVLKDAQNYTEDMAYNAVCDLSTIEVLINMHNSHEKEDKSNYNVALITKDKGLSLFSALLSNTKINGSDGDNLQVTAKLTSSIFGDDEDLLNTYEKWLKGEY
ncbi:hypothetical protein Ping_0121 [Psychromonas ingrahamii 37]|uniref:Uncharacterized protein n=1 Tax=Psychromonas ingrahamii (strain DSM 17664 / CCUG 51855 / 37) TaxID=357804 RepID=A1SR80_PSYIN|nr:hypothetical protein [Psychromonas ingrahamii]ABM01995.1 hypothetical protein Ping_0121 [Psychromonas ingrahamii 37]